MPVQLLMIPDGCVPDEHSEDVYGKITHWRQMPKPPEEERVCQ